MISEETKAKLLDLIRALSKEVMISWDRVIESPLTQWDIDGCLTDHVLIYGWIPNKKFVRDMIIVSCYVIHRDPPNPETEPFIDEFFELRFFTSSAKYSERLAKNWEIEKDHTPCIRFFEYFRPESAGDIKL